MPMGSKPIQTPSFVLHLGQNFFSSGPLRAGGGEGRLAWLLAARAGGGGGPTPQGCSASLQIAFCESGAFPRGKGPGQDLLRLDQGLA